ncbi:hypothetical protein ISN45_At03g017430 [Arabidopsis thaliana x Arabidopsis arenosa]|uniref:Uncharacterized protein n=2 Tax=Arabidopsis TaxID=3701 RepID=A0A8T2F7Z8_ARASU|nr:hypothetical protein ISN45_At03g017430 [Arabidopsis thaliana x Arabidopsis arenosa]KAG7631526.1 hypothetical protein ISN44_As03g017410 [Arabidopsis suecica]
MKPILVPSCREVGKKKKQRSRVAMLLRLVRRNTMAAILFSSPELTRGSSF